MTRVRRAVAGDLDRLVEISSAAFTNAWGRDSLADEISRAWARVLVAEDEAGVIVAFANFWVVADELQVLNLATDPMRRRQGHARALVEAVMAIARNSGATTLHLEVRASNTAAMNLYERAGFSIVGSRPRYYEDGEDAVLMTAKV